MPVVLVRVDDRLIHGQVIGGWLPVVQAQRIVVASDRAAADPLQAGLMRMAVPDEVALDVLPVQRAAAGLAGGEWGQERVLVLFASVDDLARAVEAGAPVSEVNLGGLHDGPTRRHYAPHLALSLEECRRLSALLARGVAIECRALPGDPAIPLAEAVPGLKS